MKNFSIFILMLLSLVACNSNRLDVKLKNDPININFVNVDQLFFKKSIDTVKVNLLNIDKKYGSIVLNELSEDMHTYITDTSYKAVYKFYNTDYINAIEEAKIPLYKNLPTYEKKLNIAFQYLRHYFGDSLVPKNILFINKLFSGVTCSDTNITVGLEAFLSPTSPLFKKIPPSQIYKWQKKQMNIDFLERDVLFAWIRTRLFDDINGKLAQTMIKAGKVLYLVNACFPHYSEALILRYNDKQYDWAIKNEADVWHYIVKQQYLFKNNMQTKANFFNRGPATEGLPEGAPDRMGQFLGYRIVKNYMNQNKNVTLQELLKTKYNIILQSYEIQ